jgi:nucleoside diphosphate kinase
MERTLLMGKPDLARIVESEDMPNDLDFQPIIDMLPLLGLRSTNHKHYGIMPIETAYAHYDEHAQKPFFLELINFITSGPTAILIVEGENAVAKVRKLVELVRMGPYAKSKMENLFHASDSVEAAEREIKLHFGDIAK